MPASALLVSNINDRLAGGAGFYYGVGTFTFTVGAVPNTSAAGFRAASKSCFSFTAYQ